MADGLTVCSGTSPDAAQGRRLRLGSQLQALAGLIARQMCPAERIAPPKGSCVFISEAKAAPWTFHLARRNAPRKARHGRTLRPPGRVIQPRHGDDLLRRPRGPGADERLRYLPDLSCRGAHEGSTEWPASSDKPRSPVLRVTTKQRARLGGRQTLSAIRTCTDGVIGSAIFTGPRVARTRLATEGPLSFARHHFTRISAIAASEWKETTSTSLKRARFVASVRRRGHLPPAHGSQGSQPATRPIFDDRGEWHG